MKAVRFDCTQQGLERKKRRGKAKHRGRKRRYQKIAGELNATKAAGVYELIKNKDRHESILEICKRDRCVHILVRDAVNGILNPFMGKYYLQTGLQTIASKTTFPKFADLDRDTVKEKLYALAGYSHFQPLLLESKSEGTLSSPTRSIAAGSKALSLVTVDFSVYDTETVTKLVIQAAFTQSKLRGLSWDQFKNECSKIFLTTNEWYHPALVRIKVLAAAEAAGGGVVEAEAAGGGVEEFRGTKDDAKAYSLNDWIEMCLDRIDNVTKVANRVDENSSDSDSDSSKTGSTRDDPTAILTYATQAFKEWVNAYELHGTTEEIVMYEAIFKPVVDLEPKSTPEAENQTVSKSKRGDFAISASHVGYGVAAAAIAAFAAIGITKYGKR